MLYIVSGARDRCCILSQEVLYIVSGARDRCCILSLELGVGAVYCLRS